ncbi:class I SAM-dependent rRNA methyltransferase [Pleomorphovibrio marinus]|uniref:class I SAM-dependent rRNA methyltransferase n=1 Tax=Pleomorphovibrio marinus TaxID=2164132 RepID=UPI000E09E7DE|nr:class I SAM-dependent rRNA methyltransferase [Pleomorphovibrio marinus]
MNYPSIILKKGKEISLLRRHHWIFSGAVANYDPILKDGDLVQIIDHRERILGIGCFSPGSIMVRVLSFIPETIDQDFWNRKIGDAQELRKNIGLLDDPSTNAYRLVHGEGDLLPGLIIDIYDKTAVIQAHHIGIHQCIGDIAIALQNCFRDQITAIYDKSASLLSAPTSDGMIWGEAQKSQVLENGLKFEVDWEKGQKTGFFLDQRENRKLLGSYCKDKKVLNAFSYSGGFSVYALANGAKEVHSVDISASAINLAEQNVVLNQFPRENHVTFVDDVKRFLKEMPMDYDLVIIDPPAFAKHIRSKHKAIQAYKRINALAMKKMPKGSVLFTFSCSQVVDQALFVHTLTAAAMEVGKDIKILRQLGQPSDHPINIYHQETSYLKGLVIYVN